jgi:hypothetical protein
MGFIMHIYMKHPVHGTKVAISEQEAEMDEHDGWERFDIDNRDVISDVQPNELDIRRRRRAVSQDK